MNAGSAVAPFRTISAAAQRAQAGDTITVHAGVYRERVNPPRGGQSDAKRIIYRAAPGERVTIKGSEIVKGWSKVQGEVWKLTLPNTFFGSFNPYRDVIHGDWFDGKGRTHHTGAVYLNGDWLTEAVKLEEVMLPEGAGPDWLVPIVRGSLFNVAWFRPVSGASAVRVPAARFAAQQGIQTAPCTEGGQCVGWIDHGDWVRYEGVDFGERAERVEFRVASATVGGIIELRLDSPTGELLGTCAVEPTGDWQAWTSREAKIKPTRGVKTLCLAFKSPPPDPQFASTLNPQLWFAQVDATNTAIWARFKGIDPNRETVEINVRPTVFTPERTGIDYLTVRGFDLRHAAAPWAPPTAGQIGIISAYWCKGWIIENNEISYSSCSGVALGKYSDEWDNRAESAEGYVGTLTRALTNGWNEATVGSHLVRNNHIHHCEQTGVVGSLGCSFSTVIGNEIYDIHTRQLFGGAEMAGIKFRGAIDVVISGNHIYRCGDVAGLYPAARGDSGDHRFYNNLLIGRCSLQALDNSALACFAAGNVFTKGAQPSRFDTKALLKPEFDAGATLRQETDGWYLTFAADPSWRGAVQRQTVTTELLGKTVVSQCAFENRGGSPLSLDIDYLGERRDKANPFPGPFETVRAGRREIKVWPVEAPPNRSR